MAYDRTHPPEIVTLIYCGECEIFSFFSEECIDVQTLKCPHCTSHIAGKDVYEYANMEVVDYGSE